VAELGIGTLIDLRTPVERNRFGSVGGWIQRYVALPLLDDSEELQSFSTLGHAYIELLARREVGERLVEVLSILAVVRWPAVICCSAGKDRTGIVVSALLGSLDICDEALVDEYARSDSALPALYSQWAQNPASSIVHLQQTIPHLLAAPRDAMVRLLARTRADFGSMRHYLKAHGASPSLFEALERKLVGSVQG
jgi:protein-tyrosine phosphatase